MLSKDNLIIFALIVLIILVYLKKYYKREHFEVVFSPYYPISNQVNVKVNNLEDTIDDDRLNILKNVLTRVRVNGNDGDDSYHTFNYANRPVIKNVMTNEKLKPITNFLMEAINNNLPDGHKLLLVKLEQMSKMEVEEEVLVNFQMICEYKITTNKNYKYERQEFKNEKNDNNLIIDVEVLSTKKIDEEKLYLNVLNLMGVKGENLPGSNYYKNDDEFLFTESLTNKILDDEVRKKMDANFSKEIAGANDLILPDEDVTFTEINTEEAESFFDMN